VRRMAAVAPIIGVLIFASVATAVAQRRGGFGGGGGRFAQIPIVPNAPYDGRFTFVRVRYGPDYGFASQGLPWSHDYPSGEQHFMKIVNELSNLNLYDSARQFAEGANELNDAAQALRDAVNSKESDPQQLQKLVNRLEKSFSNFHDVEDKLWRGVKE